MRANALHFGETHNTVVQGRAALASAAQPERVPLTDVQIDEDLFDRAKRAEDVLRDLVALEDMRLRLRSLHERGHGTDYEHYHEGLPKAWDAARAVLLGPNVRGNREPTHDQA